MDLKLINHIVPTYGKPEDGGSYLNVASIIKNPDGEPLVGFQYYDYTGQVFGLFLNLTDKTKPQMLIQPLDYVEELLANKGITEFKINEDNEIVFC